MPCVCGRLNHPQNIIAGHPRRRVSAIATSTPRAGPSPLSAPSLSGEARPFPHGCLFGFHASRLLCMLHSPGPEGGLPNLPFLVPLLPLLVPTKGGRFYGKIFWNTFPPQPLIPTRPYPQLCVTGSRPCFLLLKLDVNMGGRRDDLVVWPQKAQKRKTLLVGKMLNKLADGSLFI